MTGCASLLIDVDKLDAGQRLKRAVLRLLDEQRGTGPHKRTRVGLAKALGQKANGVGMILKAKDVPHFKIRDLDTIAEYFGVPTAMLVKSDDSAVQELRPTEMQVLRHWRALPLEIQDSLLALLNYFAGVSPAEKEARRIVSKYRRLSRRDAEYLDRTLDSLLRHTAAPGTTTPDAPV